MPPRLVVGLTLALLAVPLTGCLAGDDGDQGVQPTTQNDTAEPELSGSTGQGQAANETLRYADVEANRSVIWRNSSFTTEESCLGGGCITSVVTGNQTTEHTVDLASLAPPSVPVQLEANLTYPTTAGFPTAAMTLGLATPATLYAHERSSGIGEAGLETTLVRTSGQPLLLNVSAGLAEPDGTDYTLRVSVTTFPDRIPAGVPTAVDLGGRTGPVVASASGQEASRLTVWGPDDRSLGTYNVTAGSPVELPDGSGNGATVIMVAGQQPSVALSTTDGGTLDALPLQLELGDAHDTTGPPGGVTWAFEVPSTPLAAGFYMRDEPGGSMDHAWSAVVTSSRGQVVEASRQGIVFSLAEPTGEGATQVFLSEPGQVTLAAGTYEGTFEHDGAARVSVGGAWLTYER